MTARAQRLLELVLPDARVTLGSKYGGGETASLSNVDPDDVETAVGLMDIAGFTRTSTGAEHASMGVLEFANDVTVEGLDDGYHSPDSEIAEDGTGNAGVDDNSSIDGSTRRLRVLTDVESHKFADKIFTGMLGNAEDRSGYAAFLLDFDTFLGTHRNRDDEEDGETASDTACDACTDHAIPLELLAQIAEGYEPETAGRKREKTGRSAVLSQLMTAMSGSLGERVVTAFQSGDSVALAQAIGDVGTKMAAAMPEPVTDDTDTTEAEPDPDDPEQNPTPPDDVDSEDSDAEDADETDNSDGEGDESDEDDTTEGRPADKPIEDIK